jgi:hypothetical protein
MNPLRRIPILGPAAKGIYGWVRGFEQYINSLVPCHMLDAIGSRA